MALPPATATRAELVALAGVALDDLGAGAGRGAVDGDLDGLIDEVDAGGRRGRLRRAGGVHELRRRQRVVDDADVADQPVERLLDDVGVVDRAQHPVLAGVAEADRRDHRVAAHQRAVDVEVRVAAVVGHGDVRPAVGRHAVAPGGGDVAAVGRPDRPLQLRAAGERELDRALTRVALRAADVGAGALLAEDAHPVVAGAAARRDLDVGLDRVARLELVRVHRGVVGGAQVRAAVLALVRGELQRLGRRLRVAVVVLERDLRLLAGRAVERGGRQVVAVAAEVVELGDVAGAGRAPQGDRARDLEGVGGDLGRGRLRVQALRERLEVDGEVEARLGRRSSPASRARRRCGRTPAGSGPTARRSTRRSCCGRCRTRTCG